MTKRATENAVPFALGAMSCDFVFFFLLHPPGQTPTAKKQTNWDQVVN